MSILQILEKIKNKEINFFEAIKKIEEVSINKKGEGVVYTPEYIAKYIIKQVNYDIKETIYEPSVGHGIFLFALFDYVEENYTLSSEEFSNWFNKNVYANELSIKKHGELLELLQLYFSIKGIENISYDNITCGDSLKKKYEQKFDVIVGNPPYVRTKNIDEEYLVFLKENFDSCKKGNSDLFYAFVELSNKISKRSSMIVPNSLINNKSTKNLRDLILPNLVKIIDFKTKIIFETAQIYTCIYVLNEKNSGKVYYSNNLQENAECFEHKELQDDQWIFSKLKHKKIIDVELNGRGETATLKDDFYIIENPTFTQIEGIDYVNKVFKGNNFLIEKKVTIEFFKVTKMSNKAIIINPYDENFKIIPENILRKKYPKLYAYFLCFKEELLERDKGKTEKYEEWYSYGRKQGLVKNNYLYHLFVPRMSSLPLKIVYKEISGDFLFKSGYVLSFEKKSSALKLLTILTSDDASNYIKKVGKEWPGKTAYYTFSLKHLREL